MIAIKRMSWTVHWDKILGILGGVIVLQSVLKEVFGVNVLGKKIYKGAPLLWKWIVVLFTYRKDMTNKLEKLLEKVESIEKEVKDNGGNSIKDAVKRIEANQNISLQRIEAAEMLEDRMIFRLDKDGGLVYANDAYLKTFGYTEKDLAGVNWESTIHEDDISLVRLNWQRAIDKKGRFYEQVHIYHVNGQLFTCVIKAYPITENGVLKEFYGTVTILEDSKT